jgi:ComF family protein
VCGGPLVWAWGAPVCEECTAGLRRRAATACWRCGDFIDTAADMEDLRFRGMECVACRWAPPEFERAVAYGSYQDELREMIHLLKYERVLGLAEMLGGRLAEAVLDLEGEAAAELLVVAVPLFSDAEKRRGYNQARLLADAMCKRIRGLRPGWRLQAAHGALVRRKSTANQFELSRRARRRNLAGAFEVSGNVAGCEVLLVDDILTTGATARECAKVLRRAGAAKVWVATVARACGADEVVVDPGEYVARWAS